MIPSGWREISLEDVLVEYREKTTSNNQYEVMTSSRQGLILQSEYYDGENRITNRDNTGFNVIPPDYFTYRSRSDDGSFFFNRNKLGKTGCISTYYPVFKFKDSSDDFFAYLLNRNNKIYEPYSVGTSQKVLSLNSLKEIKFVVPPKNEQEKIASILESWDKAITQTTKLIILKEKYKADLATKLLSGRIELQGYSTSWSSRKLKELGSCVRGLTYSPKNIVQNGLLVLRSSNVLNGRIALKDNVHVDIEVPEQYLARSGDILVCVRNGSRNLIGKTALIPNNIPKATHGAFMTIFRSKYNSYIFQLFQTEMYYGQVARNLGATINSINNSDLLEFSFPFPSDDAVIEKIAAILETFDREIYLLNEIVTSYQKQKQGLMQQLLTGQKRVKI